MSSQIYISLSQNDQPIQGDKLHFKRDDKNAPRAILKIQNVTDDSNIAFKIKTTAPKLF